MSQRVKSSVKSFICSILLTGCAIGRSALVKLEVIVPISKLFDDRVMIARLNAHKAIEMVSENPHGNKLL